MKFAALFFVCVAVHFQGLEATVDLSKYKMKTNNYPRPMSPVKTLKFDMHRYEPNPMVRGTRDMRAEGCGISNPPVADGRIVGGWESGVNEFPWQVALFVDDNGSVGYNWFCGGSLISDSWVLTAAHCAGGAAAFHVYLGAHNVRVDEPFRTIVDSTEYYIHPGWDDYNSRNDVALVKLPKPVNFSNIVSPICLPKMGDTSSHVGEVEILSGWGRPSDNDNNISPVLRKTNVTVVDNQVCRNYYGNIIYDGNVCISTTDGHGSCNGDSGGPLSHVDEVTGAFEQIGVVSFGSIQGCEAKLPAGLSSTQYFLPWISAITGILV